MNNRPIAFTKSIANFGTFILYPFDIEQDVPLIHSWVNLPYAQYWGMQQTTLEEVTKAYTDLCNGHTQVYIATLNHEPAFLMEQYPPEKDPIGECYHSLPGDCGMHVLLAPPPPKTIPRFSWNAFQTIMEFLFANPAHRRIVVEPDIRNEKIHQLNKKAGFVYQQIVELPHKKAHLAFCTRAGYHYSAHNQPMGQVTPAGAVNHLTNSRAWQNANRRFVRKAIAEFTHELLLTPKLKEKADGWQQYVLTGDQQKVRYEFLALKLALDHWLIHEDSIVKLYEEQPMPLNGVEFILEFKESLGIPENMLATYLEEVSSTLYGATYMQNKASFTSEELIHQDHQTLEHAMTAGHPCFVANNGRIGFNAHAYQQFAPEADRPFNMIWLAGHKSKASYTGTSDYTYQKLLQQEIGEENIQLFDQQLADQGLDPEAYYYFPMHPWQWFNKLAHIYSNDIANGLLVCLGYGDDLYSAQQSIRTTYNLSHPSKNFVKTALSILNMGFMRGLSPYYMGSTPTITEWIDELLGQDEYLQAQGFLMLREVATLGYRNTYYEPLGKTNAYNKMLSVLWRESPAKLIHGNQQPMTMAALLHVDHEGTPLVAELIKASGLETHLWLRNYMKCYLKPLLHCFYHHQLVFMPHGENLILVMENHVPVKAIMKDITEEIAVLSDQTKLPPAVSRLYAPTPEELRTLSIFTDVFDCFFRHLSAILVEQGLCTEGDFWQEVSHAIATYQQEWPELQQQFEKYDLFANSFIRSCLNRLQLKNNQQMVDLADPVSSLQFIGHLDNPLAVFKKETAYQV